MISNQIYENHHLNSKLYLIGRFSWLNKIITIYSKVAANELTND